MSKRILIVQGHPDPGAMRFCHALADAFAEGAAAAGHEIRRIEIAALDFPILRSKAEFEDGPVPEAIIPCQETIQWAEHIIVIHPLWLATMPALLKAFLEQVFRYGFALELGAPDKWPKKLLVGRSARIVITMGMPALAYRWLFGAHGLKTLRGIFRMSGIGPVRETLIGGVDGLGEKGRERWLSRARKLGAEAH